MLKLKSWWKTLFGSHDRKNKSFRRTVVETRIDGTIGATSKLTMGTMTFYWTAFSRMTLSRTTHISMTHSKMVLSKMSFNKMSLNRMTFNKMTLNRMTLSRMTLKMTLNRMTFNKMTLNRMTLSRMTLKMTLNSMTFNKLTLSRMEFLGLYTVQLNVRVYILFFWVSLCLMSFCQMSWHQLTSSCLLMLQLGSCILIIKGKHSTTSIHICTIFFLQPIEITKQAFLESSTSRLLI
jgi:hypothetical protein